jgi:hypothetical protein
MNIRTCLLYAYRILLVFYPPSFRKRYAPEMLELAAAADPAEWPLIFGDTSIGIVRCWLEGTHSTPAAAEPNAYVPLKQAPISAFVLVPGLVLSIVIIAGFSYVNYKWPPPCPNGVHVVTRVVDPGTALGTAGSTQSVRGPHKGSPQ